MNNKFGQAAIGSISRLSHLVTLNVGNESNNLGYNDIGDEGAEILAGMTSLSRLGISTKSYRIDHTSISSTGL